MALHKPNLRIVSYQVDHALEYAEIFLVFFLKPINHFTNVVQFFGLKEPISADFILNFICSLANQFEMFSELFEIIFKYFVAL